ncbi:enoyl-CoA hydratase/isomerase family protein [Cohnella sp. AR92]|uniref:enoyl-CoA hydratase/isomerase family protein n=1 Tax=Cohnella sp. AR92 TaxID=648716 RepID=UPI000F8DDA37|nr:enoyl-CoA hydratase-related protein [Cohnella sp. AR92]RUS45726.1 enoyl-CoA hydratase/isomerase family protein [Cohnella sp. AR92]
MQLETLELTYHGKVAVIHLNRPPMNPLNTRLFQEMYQMLEELEQNDDVGAIVLTGKGERAFVAGADIGEMKDLDYNGMTKMNQLSRKAFHKAESIGKPVIAAINGLALGGGCELALCCDFRICSDNAKIAMPEINLAIIPGGGGTQRLQRLIGQAKAKELLYFGDMISAQDALACGLVNKVVPLDNLLDAALEWGNKLAEKPMVAMRMMKTAVQAGADMDLENGLTLEAACFGNTFATADRLEGMTAFFEKRKPQYAGR